MILIYYKKFPFHQLLILFQREHLLLMLSHTILGEQIFGSEYEKGLQCLLYHICLLIGNAKEINILLLIFLEYLSHSLIYLIYLAYSLFL